MEQSTTTALPIARTASIPTQKDSTSAWLSSHFITFICDQGYEAIDANLMASLCGENVITIALLVTTYDYVNRFVRPVWSTCQQHCDSCISTTSTGTSHSSRRITRIVRLGICSSTSTAFGPSISCCFGSTQHTTRLMPRPYTS